MPIVLYGALHAVLAAGLGGLAVRRLLRGQPLSDAAIDGLYFIAAWSMVVIGLVAAGSL